MKNMDNVTKEQRSSIMRSIKSKNTSIELVLRKALFARNIRYRINRKVLGVSCDICIAKYKLIVFCDGDFWHGKIFSKRQPETNRKYWNEKISRNVERDLEQTMLLRDNGWIVLRYWESDIRTNTDKCVNEIIKNIERRKKK